MVLAAAIAARMALRSLTRSNLVADGQVMGEIKTLFLDSNTWSVESLRVELRSESADQLGASRSMFHAGSIEIPIGMVQSVGETMVLAVGANELRQVLPSAGEQAPAHS